MHAQIQCFSLSRPDHPANEHLSLLPLNNGFILSLLSFAIDHLDSIRNLLLEFRMGLRHLARRRLDGIVLKQYSHILHIVWHRLFQGCTAKFHFPLSS